MLGKLLLYTTVLMLFFRVGSAQNLSDSLHPGFTRYYYPNGNISSEGIIKEGKPDGYWRSYFESGKLKSEGNRLNHQLDGIWIFYDENGWIILETRYVEGIKQGLRITRTPEERIEENFENDQKQGWAYHYDAEGFLTKTVPYENGRENGMVKFYNRDSLVITMMEYRKGVAVSREFINRYDGNKRPHGLWRTFYPDGTVREEFSYKYGKLDGYYKKFDREGNLELIRKYAEGELIPDSDELVEYEIRRDYYPNMKVKIEGSYRDGVADGFRKEYRQDGSLEIVYLLDKGRIMGSGILDEQGMKQGFWKEYFREGGLRSEGNYANGIRTGAWIFYFPEGTVEQKGNYNDKGKEQGKWVWYYQDGILRREEEYKAGVLNGPVSEYDEKGNIIASGTYEEGEEEGKWYYQEEGYRQEGTYIEGERDGEWNHYYPDGNLSFTGKYIDGNPDGKHHWYNPDGSLRMEGNFIMGIRHGQWRFYSETGVLLLLVEYRNGFEIKYENQVIKPELPGSDL